MDPAAAAALLSAAIGQLSALGVIIRERYRNRTDTDTGVDAVIEIEAEGRTTEYTVRVEQRPTVASIQSAVVTPPHHDIRPENILFVADHMPERVADLAREAEVSFVDRAGNAFVRGNGLRLDVRGRPRIKPEPPIATPSRAFRGTGLRITFLFLAAPETVTWTVRDIARSVGASIGTVHGVFTDLTKAGFIFTEESRRLVRTRELLARWTSAYALDMFDRLTLARFDAPDPQWWRDADDDLRRAGAQWGGETAAHKLNPHLRPERAVIYAAEVPTRLVVAHRLTKAHGRGSVEIRSRFWRIPDDDGLTVPTPLIYADLFADDDPRLAEAATDLRRSDALLQRLDGG
jgi:hypothetical protein